MTEAADMPLAAAMPSMTVYVCATCRRAETEAGTERTDGARLLARVRATVKRETSDPPLLIRGVACMANCDRACTVSFVAPGKLSYVFGGLEPDADSVEAVLALAALYAQSADGITVWRERPKRLRRGLIARVPPFGFDAEPVET